MKEVKSMTLLTTQENDVQKYKLLDHKEIVKCVKNLRFYRDEEQVSVTEVSDGTINHVYRLTGEYSEKIIFKQAVPYARNVGDAMPLPLDRITFEAMVLQEYDRILPGSVPKVLHLDADLAVVVMEDMFPMQMGRDALINGTETNRFADDIGKICAKTIFYTSDFYMDPIEKKMKVASLSNPRMRELTEELFFDSPYNFHESNFFEEELKSDVLALTEDNRLQLEVAKLKHKFKTKADALLHGDLHTGSIFMDEDKTVIFDTEFALYGPFGFDIAQFIANLYLNGIGSPVFLNKRHKEASETWTVFKDTFSSLWRNESNEPYTKVDGFLPHLLDEIFVDMLGYAGCELVRRSIGIAQANDLNHEQDDQKRIKRRRKALDLGKYLILERHNIRSFAELEDWLSKN